MKEINSNKPKVIINTNCILVICHNVYRNGTRVHTIPYTQKSWSNNGDPVINYKLYKL